MAVISRAI